MSPTSAPTALVPAAIYARISRDRAGGGLGVERQEADCRALAERLGWDVVAVFVDNDISAYSGAPRPQYRAMLDAVRAGRVRGVVAWHTDRLHRRTLELEEFVAVAESHHLQVQTVTSGSVDLSSASGRMVARMLGAAAQHEIDHARERMKRAKEQMAADGKYRGGPRPYGFQKDGVTHKPDEADVIREATTAILSGRSLRAVADDLNRRSVATSAGNVWTYARLRDVLIRPRNAGLLGTGRADRGEVQIVGTASWEPIVDEDTWRAVYGRLTDSSRRKQDGNARRWLGSGIYTCGIEGCTGRMRVTATGGTASRAGHRTYHYRCEVASHLTVAQVHTDAHVRAVVADLVRDPRVVAAMMPEVDDGALAADRERRAVLAARLSSFETDYAAGSITGAQLSKATATVTANLAEVDARLVEGTQRGVASPVLGAPDPGAAFLNAPVDVQRAVVRAVLAVEVMPAGKRGAKWSPDRLRLTPVGRRK